MNVGVAAPADTTAVLWAGYRGKGGIEKMVQGLPDDRLGRLLQAARVVAAAVEQEMLTRSGAVDGRLGGP